MQPCTLTIVTTTDGEAHTVNRTAEIELMPLSAFLRYHDEGAIVEIDLQNGKAKLNRTGDYTIFLPLTEGEKTLGRLGLGEDSGGNLPVTADKIAYSITKTALIASLKYRLHFGEETQTVSLRLSAKL